MKETFHKLCSRPRAGLLAGALAIAVSSLVAGRYVLAKDAPKAPPVHLTVNESDLPREGKYITSFAPVVKRVAPSVVKVYITTKAKMVTGPESPFTDDFFRRFFGDQFNSGGQERNFHVPRQHGLGSGVIVTKDGYILTNNHVVDEAENIRVALNDGREFTAKVIGHDPKTDIAVVKIDAHDLPYMTLADSDKIEVGDLALAIGNPFGVGQTVTMGMVSAKGRGNVGVGTDYEDFIQTDAAINPGNSGGALVDAEGRLIGINTAILSRSGGSQGIGFAVPINMARSVMESLVTEGRVVRGYLGVLIQDINPDLAKEFNLSQDHGALVSDVTPKSPAEKAGLKSGDVILDFNGKPVTDSRHLKLQVAETTPNTTVPVKVLRDGKEKTIELTVKELPGSEKLAKADKEEDTSSDTLNGVTVSDIDATAKRQLDLPNNVKGAVITNVDQDSAAYEAGLRPGDVIEEINRKPVQSADDAVKLTENVKSKKTLLKVWSKGGSRYLVVNEEKGQDKNG
jgi:serine protease Do